MFLREKNLQKIFIRNYANHQKRKEKHLYLNKIFAETWTASTFQGSPLGRRQLGVHHGIGKHLTGTAWLLVRLWCILDECDWGSNMLCGGYIGAHGMSWRLVCTMAWRLAVWGQEWNAWLGAGGIADVFVTVWGNRTNLNMMKMMPNTACTLSWTNVQETFTEPGIHLHITLFSSLNFFFGNTYLL